MYQALQWISATQPRAVVVENVRGFCSRTSEESKSPAELFLQKLAQEGYSDAERLDLDTAIFHEVSRTRCLVLS